MEAIQDSAVYVKEVDRHLTDFYYLLSWKRYLEEENTWEPSSAIQYLRKLLSKFYHKNPNRPTATSPPIYIASPMAKPIVKPTESSKRKQGRPIRRAKKCTKWGNKEESVKNASSNKMMNYHYYLKRKGMLSVNG